MRHCTDCGTSTDPDWHFCRSCGAAVDIEAVSHRTTFCTECSHAIAPSWRFCSRCGATTPVSDIDEAARANWPAAEIAVHIPPTLTSPTRGLTPEIVDVPDVELISRRFEAALPPDAPAPPPLPEATPAPTPPEPEVPDAVPDAAELETPVARGLPEPQQQEPELMEPPDQDQERAPSPKSEPPLTIYSRDRLGTAPIDLSDYYDDLDD